MDEHGAGEMSVRASRGAHSEMPEFTKSVAHDSERQRYVASAVLTYPIVVERAHGIRVWDVDGREYLDFAGGVGSLNTGHTPDEIVAAVREQIQRFMHVGYSVAQYPLYTEVCERLTRCHPGDFAKKAVLSSTGAEAVENAVKVARGATGRPAVLTFGGGFHGRTLLTASLTYSAGQFERNFHSVAADIHRAVAPNPYRGVTVDDALASIRRVLTEEVDPRDVAAAVLEPVQGEGGFVPVPSEFLLALQQLCHEYGIVFVCDEIQSGLGRTGLPSACLHHPGVEPDVIAWGKSLGGGLPLSAVTARAELMDALPAGSIASGTSGGNPVSCAAAKVVLDTVLDPSVQQAAADLGHHVVARLRKLQRDDDRIGDVRALGPMVGAELVQGNGSDAPATDHAKKVIQFARDHGLIIKSCGMNGNVLRFLFPVNSSVTDVDEGLDRLEAALRDAPAPSRGRTPAMPA